MYDDVNNKAINELMFFFFHAYCELFRNKNKIIMKKIKAYIVIIIIMIRCDNIDILTDNMTITDENIMI